MSLLYQSNSSKVSDGTTQVPFIPCDECYVIISDFGYVTWFENGKIRCEAYKRAFLQICSSDFHNLKISCKLRLSKNSYKLQVTLCYHVSLMDT